MREDAGTNWTTETPTAPGYYAWREPGTLEPCIVEVDIERWTVSSLGTDETPSLADTGGETILIDGTITKEDLGPFITSHSDPSVQSQYTVLRFPNFEFILKLFPQPSPIRMGPVLRAGPISVSERRSSYPRAYFAGCSCLIDTAWSTNPLLKGLDDAVAWTSTLSPSLKVPSS